MWLRPDFNMNAAFPSLWVPTQIEIFFVFAPHCISKWHKHPYFLMTEVLMIEALTSNNSKDCKGNLLYTAIRLLLIL